MAATVFGLDVVVTLLLAVFVLREYGDIRRSLGVSFITIIAWFFSFAIVLIVPMDISSTFYWDCVRRWYCHEYSNTTEVNSTVPVGCEPGVSLTNSTALDLCAASGSCACERPWSYDYSNPIPQFWRVVFWSLQLLTWIILPHVGSYLSAGDFTFWQKLKSSLKENAIINGSLALLVVALLVYMVVAQHLTKDALAQIASGAANTWGLIMQMLMLGFGLVDIPRYLWRRYDLSTTLKLYQYQAAKMSLEMAEASEKLEEVYEEVRSVAGRLPKEDPLRKYVSIILMKCPFGSAQDYTDYKTGDEKPINMKYLAGLHGRLIKAQRTVHRSECLWDRLMVKAFNIEDCINLASDPERKFTHSYKAPYQGTFKKVYPKLLWWWKIKIQPYFFLLMAAVCTLLSLALIWSEVLFFFEKPRLSIFALLLKEAHGQYLYIESLSFVTMLYMAVCTYRVVFKMRLFNFYYLAPHQMTDSGSLIFSAMLLSRLIVPIGLNFVSMAHLDTHVTSSNVIQQETWFTQTMGHLDLLPWLKKFNTYYPTVILIVSVCTLFNLWDRFLLMFGVQRFIDDDDGAQELATEGKNLIRRERRKMEKNGGTMRKRSPESSRRGGAASSRIPSGRVDDEDLEEGIRNVPRVGKLSGAATKGKTSATSTASGSGSGSSSSAASASINGPASLASKTFTKAPIASSSSSKSKKTEKPSFSLSSLGKLLNMNKEDDDEAELLPTSVTSSDSSSSLASGGKKISSYLGRGKKPGGAPKNLFNDL